VPSEDEPGPGVCEVELDLARLEQRVHRNDHRTRPQHAVVRHGELRDVGQHDPDARAGPDPSEVQQPRHPRTRGFKGRVGDLGLVELERDVVGVTLSGRHEVARKIAHLLSSPYVH